MCNVSSPTRNLCMFYLSQYVLYGILSPGSLLDRVVRSGQSPISLVTKSPISINNNVQYSDGHVDSLKMLLYHENFIKPYSEEHLLVHLLTTSM